MSTHPARLPDRLSPVRSSEYGTEFCTCRRLMVCSAALALALRMFWPGATLLGHSGWGLLALLALVLFTGLVGRAAER
jgi:hypothetical protein